MNRRYRLERAEPIAGHWGRLLCPRLALSAEIGVHHDGQMTAEQSGLPHALPDRRVSDRRAAK